MPEHSDAYRLLAESLQQQVVFLQHQVELLTARLAELAAPGINARLDYVPKPPAPPSEKSSPNRYSPAAFAQRVDVAVSPASTTSAPITLSDVKNADIEESFSK